MLAVPEQDPDYRERLFKNCPQWKSQQETSGRPSWRKPSTQAQSIQSSHAFLVTAGTLWRLLGMLVTRYHIQTSDNGTFDRRISIWCDRRAWRKGDTVAAGGGV